MPSPAALKAGKAVIELGLDSEGFRGGLDKLEAKLKSFGQGLQTVGKQLAAVGGAVTGFIGLAVAKFTDLGSELVDASARTGLAVETLSALKFAAEQSGTSLDTLERGLRNLAKKGGDTSIEGIMRLADQLAAIEDPAERARFAMENFGLRAGTELIPLLAGGSDALRQLMQAAADTGNVMSTDAAQAAEKLGDSIDQLKAGFVTFMVQVATAVAGDLQAFIDKTIQITTGIIHWIQQHQTLIRTIAIAGASLLALGTTMFVLGKAFVAVAAAIGFVRVAMTALAKHPWLVLITLGVVAVGEMTGAFDALARKIDEVTGVSSTFADGNQKLLQDLEKLKIESMDAADAMGDLEDVQIPEVGEIATAKLERELQLSTRFDPVADNLRETGGGRSRVESLFDTRLAKQVFGFADGSRIEKQQLNELKKLNQNVEDLKANRGIPVF